MAFYLPFVPKVPALWNNFEFVKPVEFRDYILRHNPINLFSDVDSFVILDCKEMGC